jgi:hypothetical protein
VATRFQLPAGTVYRWRHELKRYGAAAVTRDEKIGQLVMAYLEQGLITMREQLKHFGNPAWLFEQTAAGAAMLLAVEIDALVRMIELTDAFLFEPRVDCQTCERIKYPMGPGVAPPIAACGATT